VDAYNGFSGKERVANGVALRRAIQAGSVPAPHGPCSICGDPGARVEYHSEDYSKPYRWTPPAAYVVCLACHRNKLHKRFANPEMWETFKAHVRRGGYASDLKNAEVARELQQYVEASRSGSVAQLRQLRPYPHVVGTEWWAPLTTTQGA
jgi:hypothetical protein